MRGEREDPFVVEDRRFLFYQSGLATFRDNRCRPGLAAHGLCMQACLERGLEEYDFLEGESRYKRGLSNTERELVWGSGRRGVGRWLLLDARRAAGRVRQRLIPV